MLIVSHNREMLNVIEICKLIYNKKIIKKTLNIQNLVYNEYINKGGDLLCVTF